MKNKNYQKRKNIKKYISTFERELAHQKNKISKTKINNLIRNLKKDNIEKKIISRNEIYNGFNSNNNIFIAKNDSSKRINDLEKYKENEEREKFWKKLDFKKRKKFEDNISENKSAKSLVKTLNKVYLDLENGLITKKDLEKFLNIKIEKYMKK